jgi:hypothetical protein
MLAMKTYFDSIGIEVPRFAVERNQYSVARLGGAGEIAD